MPRGEDRAQRRVKVRAPGHISRNLSVDAQLQSNLCQLPIELLSEIAGYIFSGFKLHYCSASCIYKPKEISSRQLALVRTCHLLRRMLIPVLAAHTTELMFESHLRHETKVRSDQIDSTTIKMSHQFRAGIRDIHFARDTIRFPNYKLFPNLERIHMKHAPDSIQESTSCRGRHPSMSGWSNSPGDTPTCEATCSGMEEGLKGVPSVGISWRNGRSGYTGSTMTKKDLRLACNSSTFGPRCFDDEHSFKHETPQDGESIRCRQDALGNEKSTQLGDAVGRRRSIRPTRKKCM